MTVGLVSLGCAKNLVDLQVMGGTLLADGIELSPDPDNADVVLVNTCAFIEDARKEADAEIKRACALKRAGKVGHVVVSGCLPQRYGKALCAKYPDVDAWLGIDHLYDISRIVAGLVEAGRKGGAEVCVSNDRNCLFEPPVPDLALTGGVHAFLKIAEGCNHACAYCAIPGIRGKLRSRGEKEIVAEAKALVAAGYREIDVVAQDVTAYGRDFGDGTTLASLLKKLDRIKGDFWLRLLYGYPSYVTDELLEVISKSRHICRYLDIPVQHSHPGVLRAMRRADTVKHVADMPARLRAACPGLALRTTCLVGFPGETDEAFEHLLSYVREAEFDQLGVFCFSPEEGTAAAKMEGAVPPDVARRRRARLMRAQKKVVETKLAKLVGEKIEVMLVAPAGEKGQWRARARFQAPDVDGETLVSGAPRSARPGDVLSATVLAASGYDIVAEVRPA